MEEPSSYVITLRSSPFVLALSSNAEVHTMTHEKSMHLAWSTINFEHLAHANS